MKARSMPAQNSLLPLDTHMCQRLRQCVNPLPEQMTILPNHQPKNTKPSPGTSIFFVVNNHKALRPGAAPGISAYVPCDCEAFISKTGRARPLHLGTPVVWLPHAPAVGGEGSAGVANFEAATLGQFLRSHEDTTGVPKCKGLARPVFEMTVRPTVDGPFLFPYAPQGGVLCGCSQ